MFLQLLHMPGSVGTKGDDWMDQSVHGCKDILPGDHMKRVSSLFILIAPQGTFAHSCLLETRGCASVLTWKNVRRILHAFTSYERKPFNSFRIVAGIQHTAFTIAEREKECFFFLIGRNNIERKASNICTLYPFGINKSRPYLNVTSYNKTLHLLLFL